MMRRHAAMIVRDPILYIGRCGAILIMNIVFAIVYFSARDDTQDQALNKMWLHTCFMGVPSNLAVVAVYALNEEFKSDRTGVPLSTIDRVGEPKVNKTWPYPRDMVEIGGQCNDRSCSAGRKEYSPAKPEEYGKVMKP